MMGLGARDRLSLRFYTGIWSLSSKSFAKGEKSSHKASGQTEYTYSSLGWSVAAGNMPMVLLSCPNPWCLSRGATSDSLGTPSRAGGLWTGKLHVTPADTHRGRHTPVQGPAMSGAPGGCGASAGLDRS